MKIVYVFFVTFHFIMKEIHSYLHIAQWNEKNCACYKQNYQHAFWEEEIYTILSQKIYIIH